MNGLHGVPVQCAVTLQQSRIRNGGRGERGGEEEVDDNVSNVYRRLFEKGEYNSSARLSLISPWLLRNANLTTNVRLI